MSDNALCEDGYAYSADQKCCSQNQIQQSPWARFVLPAKAVHENQYGKGLWAKMPADGHTTLTKPYLAGQSEMQYFDEHGVF